MSQKFSLETKYDLLQPSKRFICTEHIVSLNMKGWKILWTFFCNHLLGKVRKLVLAHLSMSITKNLFCRYLFLCIPFFSYAIIEIFLVFPRIFLVILKLYCYYIILGFDLSISRFSSLLLKLHYALLKMLAYYLITRFWIQFGMIRIFSVNLKCHN